MATMATPAGPVAKVLAFCLAPPDRVTACPPGRAGRESARILCRAGHAQNKQNVFVRSHFASLFVQGSHNMQKMDPVRDVKSEH